MWLTSFTPFRTFAAKRSPAHAPGVRRAFTLTELLIVIGLIVLLLALALPAFNLMNGSKSIAGSENLIGAYLGRARAEAIGVQDARGIAFYVDKASGRTAMAIVQAPHFGFYDLNTTFARYAYITYAGKYYVSLQDGNKGNGPSASPSFWAEVDQYVVDATSDTDTPLLPPGVGLQLVNPTDSTVVTNQDRYLREGVILFDGNGRLATKQTSLAYGGRIGVQAGGFPQGTGGIQNVPALNGNAIFSSMGIVLYDSATFDGQHFDPNGPIDPALTSSGTYDGNETNEETWLDTNATPVLINRYNGTLVKGE